MCIKKIFVLLVLLIGGAGSARAYCFAEAAKRFGLDESLLRAIATTENAKYDPALVVQIGQREYIGLMMVSTIWLPELSRLGVTRESLKDACVNVLVGAYILKDAVRMYGLTWKAVGAYNTGVYSDNTDAQKRYIKKVWNNIKMRKR